MNEKRINARFTPKGDIEANWKKATGFVPLDKEVIIYKPDEDHSYSRMKIGDGITEINDLPFLAAQDSLPVAYINDDGELIFELGKGITDAYINQQGELEIKVETEEGEKPLVLGKVKGRTPEFRLTEKILEIKYDDETVWNTLVDFSTIASSFDLRLNEETYFLEAQREVDGEWEQMVDLSALKLAHEHSNKDVLDRITSSIFEQIKDAISKGHTHENANALNQITDEHIENVDKIPEIEEDVAELVNNPTKQLVEGIFYTDENKKGFSANKNAVPTADSAWIIGEASNYHSFDEAMTSAILKVVTTTQSKSTTTTVTIEIVCVDLDVALWLQTVMNTDSYHTGIVFEDTPDKTYYIKASSATVSDTTVSVKFTFINGQDTFTIEGNIIRAIQSIVFYPKNGISSSAEGLETIAAGDYSHVQGQYNEIDTEGKYAHIVGNGTGEDNRSNAHTLDWEGNAWYAGSVSVPRINIEVLDETHLITLASVTSENSKNNTTMLVGQNLLSEQDYYVIYDGVTYKLRCAQDEEGYYIGSTSEYGFALYQDSSGRVGLSFADEVGHDLLLKTMKPYMTDLIEYINSLDTGLTEEQATDLAANTEARHSHENKDVLDTITDSMLLTEAQKLAIDNDTVPLVTELPTDAKFGDLCRYSRANEFSTDDGGKTIYINPDGVRDYLVSAYPINQRHKWSLTTATGDEFYIYIDCTWSGMGELTAIIYEGDRLAWFSTYMFKLDEDGNIVHNKDVLGLVYETEMPKSYDIPQYEFTESIEINGHEPYTDSLPCPYTIFYHEPKLMIYLGEWVEFPSKSELESLNDRVQSLEETPNITEANDEDIMDTMTEMGLVDPVTLSDGSILISNNNEIYSL